MKTCTKCHKPKSLESFHKQSRSKDGRRSVCKACRKKLAQTPHSRQLHQVRNKRYRESKHGKKVREEYQRDYRENGPGREKQRAYDKSEQGKRKRRTNARKYRKMYPLRIKAQGAVNSAVHRGKIPSAKTLTCQKCGEPADSYHHYLGYEKEHWFDIQPLCQTCHRNTHR